MKGRMKSAGEEKQSRLRSLEIQSQEREEADGMGISLGIGFPGWHTECVVMSVNNLGIPFDIHAAN
jgi:cysteinyl-tRNA synthetase